MYLGDESAKKRKRLIRGISACLVLLFVIAFWQELGVFFGLVLKFLASVVLGNLRLDELVPQENRRELWRLAFNFFVGFAGVFSVWLGLLAAQAILPVEGFVDTYRTAWHLLLYMARRHGPAVFVRDGKVLSTKEDEREGPGVAVVDFNSAIVLEERVPPPGIGRLIDAAVHSVLGLIGLAEFNDSPRAAGPGIVFTKKGEKIRGAVDLRTQFRAIPGITAYTRDGIEVKTRIFSNFTVGQDPDILQVTYDGPPRPENLRVVTLEKLPENKVRVTGMVDELDQDDRDEIHHFIRVWQHANQSLPYKPPSEPATGYNADRVFAAVFSEARSDKQRLAWTELPVRVAAGYFREMISQINYDQLYNVGALDGFPIPAYKARLKTLMRNNGILAYRLIFHKSGQPIKKRTVYAESELVTSEVKNLTYPKMLRERGIKIIMAGFGDIQPVNDLLYQRRLEAWRATWQRDTQIIAANREMEAIRLRNHARAQAQQELLVSLNDILQNQSISREVMAVRILQSLESLAADTKTKDLLPGGTLDILKTTRDWLMPGDMPPPALQPGQAYPVDGDQL